jgi:hypothetical protein
MICRYIIRRGNHAYHERLRRMAELRRFATDGTQTVARCSIP